MNSEAEDILVPVFMTLDSIQGGLSEASSKLVRYWLRCKYSKLHVVCSQLCGCSKATLNAASTVTRLC